MKHNNVPHLFKEFENLSVEKKTLSTALGFEPRSFNCRSTPLTTELHRRPTSPSPLKLEFYFLFKLPLIKKYAK